MKLILCLLLSLPAFGQKLPSLGWGCVHGLTGCSPTLPLSYGSHYHATPMNGLVAYWTFDEGTGSSVSDSSGGGNTGTWHGTLGSQWTQGKIGAYAGSFDGTDNYVDFGAATNFYFANTTFTAAGWIKTSTNGVIIAHTLNNGGWAVALELGCSSGQFGFVWKNSVNTTGDVCATVTVEDGNWHFFTVVATTNTTTAASNTALLYIDSVLLPIASSTSTTYGTPSGDLQIGRRSAGNFFTGTIDNIPIYSRALSPEEVQALYLSSLH